MTVLSRRALNRALLARQMLLSPQTLSVPDALEQLVGLQAQEPQAPYVALWTRLENFSPHELSTAIVQGDAVRGQLMRATIHLVTRRDWHQLRPLLRPVLERDFRGSSFAKALSDVDLDRVVAWGRELISEEPRSRAELGRLLAEEWPGADPPALAQAVTYLTPVVQVPPRGLWGQGGGARWSPMDPQSDSSLDELIPRYLRSFGPATVRDIQAWSGFTRLAELLAGQPEHLRAFTDEEGRKLLDIPDGSLPDPRTPAPPRFLAPFDNAILSHAVRDRIVDPQVRRAISRDRLLRTFLLDGFVAGTWQLKDEGLDLRPLRPLSTRDRRALTDEGERLLAFVLPDAAPRLRLHPC